MTKFLSADIDQTGSNGSRKSAVLSLAAWIMQTRSFAKRAASEFDVKHERRSG